MSDFGVSFANLLRARFPYIYVGTWEEDRVLAMIRETARNAELVRTPRSASRCTRLRMRSRARW